MGDSAQVMFSRLSPNRFHYGPIEWSWRALMVGRAPPFRKALRLLRNTVAQLITIRPDAAESADRTIRTVSAR